MPDSAWMRVISFPGSASSEKTIATSYGPPFGEHVAVACTVPVGTATVLVPVATADVLVAVAVPLTAVVDGGINVIVGGIVVDVGGTAVFVGEGRIDVDVAVLATAVAD